MKRLSSQFLKTALIGASLAMAVVSTPAMAQHVGGYRGGYHGGYYRGSYGPYRGGYYRGGYWGWHGGYWRGGYWGGGWWGPWGVGGLALGLYAATLPWNYSTYWYGGVPYYYAANTYYVWDAGAGQYVTTAPPAEIMRGASAAPGESASGGAPSSAGPADVIAYPKNGQNQEQQAKDKFECHKWAAGQTGFDPATATSAPPAQQRGEYNRAQSACLEGRGYSVK